MELNFAKYEGAGNDFILIDTRDTAFIPESKMVARLCDRHFGIGADGLMTLGESAEAECSMRYYNPDGSVGEMCGNGGRCFTLFAHHLGLDTDPFHFESLDGIHRARLLSADPFKGVVELGMIDVKAVKSGEGWWFLNTGVPHYVEFREHIDTIDVIERGSDIRHDTVRFPQGTNVNFAEIIGQGTIRIRTYERGVENETLACGTGATAVALVANLCFQPEVREFKILARGGVLKITFEQGSHPGQYYNISLSGEARRVFHGTLNTENF